MNIYKGLTSHRPGLGLFENTVSPNYATREFAYLTELQSPLFPQFFGSEIVAIPNVGLIKKNGQLQARPAIFLTDLLRTSNDEGTGLAPEGPDEPYWVTSLREHLLPAIESNRLLTVLPGDQHLNPNFWNPSSVTRFSIDLEQLTPKQRQTVTKDPRLAALATSGDPITISDYFKIFGIVSDPEDTAFIPHARQGLVRYIPSIEALLQRQHKLANQEQTRLGHNRPIARIVPDFKTGLNVLSPADSWGLGGNNMANFAKAAYEGIYTDGSQHATKIAIVGGTAAEYTVERLLDFLVDYNFYVVWCLPWTGTMGVDSLVNVAYKITSRYQTRVFPTWDWPYPEFLGPEPAGFKKLVALMQTEAYVDAFGANHQEVAKIANQLSGLDLGFVNSQFLNLVQLKRYDGTPLVWTMDEIRAHLQKESQL